MAPTYVVGSRGRSPRPLWPRTRFPRAAASRCRSAKPRYDARPWRAGTGWIRSCGRPSRRGWPPSALASCSTSPPPTPASSWRCSPLSGASPTSVRWRGRSHRAEVALALPVTGGPSRWCFAAGRPETRLWSDLWASASRRRPHPWSIPICCSCRSPPSTGADTGSATGRDITIVPSPRSGPARRCGPSGWPMPSRKSCSSPTSPMTRRSTLS